MAGAPSRFSITALSPPSTSLPPQMFFTSAPGVRNVIFQVRIGLPVRLVMTIRPSKYPSSCWPGWQVLPPPTIAGRIGAVGTGGGAGGGAGACPGGSADGRPAGGAGGAPPCGSPPVGAGAAPPPSPAGADAEGEVFAAAPSPPD